MYSYVLCICDWGGYTLSVMMRYKLTCMTMIDNRINYSASIAYEPCVRTSWLWELQGKERIWRQDESFVFSSSNLFVIFFPSSACVSQCILYIKAYNFYVHTADWELTEWSDFNLCHKHYFISQEIKWLDDTLS